MLSINDLQSGSVIKIDNDPYQVLEAKHLHMGRGSSSVQTRIKNLRTGQVLERNYKPADSFEETEVEKKDAKFLYAHREEFWFCEAGNPKARFMLKQELLGESAVFLKPNLPVTALLFEGTILAIELPIKVDYKVIEAPPAVRGNTAQGGTKLVTLEGGAKINAPLFINEGDVVRVNTQIGEYTERMEKA